MVVGLIVCYLNCDYDLLFKVLLFGVLLFGVLGDFLVFVVGCLLVLFWFFVVGLVFCLEMMFFFWVEIFLLSRLKIGRKLSDKVMSK